MKVAEKSCTNRKVNKPKGKLDIREVGGRGAQGEVVLCSSVTVPGSNRRLKVKRWRSWGEGCYNRLAPGPEATPTAQRRYKD